MVYSPPFDGAIVFFIYFGIFFGICGFVVVTILELVTLYILAWGSFVFSMITSFIMNLISTIIGVFVVIGFDRGASVETFLIMFISSVVIEGLVMHIMKPSKIGVMDVWMLAAFCNVITYIFPGAVILVFL